MKEQLSADTVILCGIAREKFGRVRRNTNVLHQKGIELFHSLCHPTPMGRRCRESHRRCLNRKPNRRRRANGDVVAPVSRMEEGTPHPSRGFQIAKGQTGCAVLRIYGCSAQMALMLRPREHHVPPACSAIAEAAAELESGPCCRTRCEAQDGRRTVWEASTTLR